jgi:SAM-dependent methyltransferase
VNARTKARIKQLLRSMQRAITRTGSQRECYVCRRRFRHFAKFQGGSRNIPELQRRLAVIGSDVDNFGCLFCDSHDRERHLFMYFDKTGVWDRVPGGQVLHFAPEKNLSARLAASAPLRYVRADLFPAAAGVERIDATAIPYPEGTFDLLLANHILEHIPDYRAALAEFHRVLKPGGVAILQTPYSSLLKENFEDENIDTDELRLFFHGQADHARTFGAHGLIRSLQEAGFELRIVHHRDLFDEEAAHRYGVNPSEDLICVVKPLGDANGAGRQNSGAQHVPA